MNWEKFIIRMGRSVLRRLMMRGIFAGIDRIFAKKDGTPPTREEKAQRRQAKDMSRKFKRGTRLARRMNRF